MPARAAATRTRVSAEALANGTHSPREKCGGGRNGEVWGKTKTCPATLPCFLSLTAARVANSPTAPRSPSRPSKPFPKDAYTDLLFGAWNGL